MPYRLYNKLGECIPTIYFTELEDNGQVAIWFGADIDDPNREFVAWADTMVNAYKLIEQLRTAERLDNGHAAVLWSVDDAMDLLGISDERAETFWETNEKQVRDRLIEHGHEVIKILHQQDLEDDDSPYGKSCGNCGRDLNEDIAVDVEGRGWYCYNCAGRYTKD